jgi:hypothetical protein
MEKYGLSSKALQDLYVKLLDKGLLRGDQAQRAGKRRRTIQVKELLDDIQSGMSKPDLLAKYGISSATLQRICKKLLNSRGLPEHVIDPELPLYTDTIVLENIRKVPRNYVDFDLPVYDEARPEIHGKVRDISEEGIAVRGLDVNVEDVKRLVILGDFFGEVASFELGAKCRWAKVLGLNNELIAGFQIVNISDGDLRELRRLIELISLRGSTRSI